MAKKELLLAGKKVGKPSFLSQHCTDGIYDWGFQDGKMMHDGLVIYSNTKPKPLVGRISLGKAVEGRKPRKRLATA